jgi:hypothetical protein
MICGWEAIDPTDEFSLAQAKYRDPSPTAQDDGLGKRFCAENG